MIENAICSFCGKAHNEVRKLVASPDGMTYICDSCVEICREIVRDVDCRHNGVRLSLPSPVEIKRQLDEYIVGQENAKRTMAVAVYNHYKRLNYNFDSKNKDKIELDKSNILLIGPTGVGKTLIAKTLARILKVPFACVDATTLTEAGYVGDDVETVLSKLLMNADYDIKRAEMGIVYIDEIDKIARKSESTSLTRDVSGEGVQQALLKILEGTVANVVPTGGRKHPHQDTVQINTSNILFICGGAFVRLRDIVEARENKQPMGFVNTKQTTNKQESYKFVKKTRPNDLIEFGLIPEFVGRLPIVVGLDDMDEKTLVNILSTPKNSLIEQYKTIFRLDGVELEVEKSAIREIAKKAIKLDMGARGLRTIMEESMLEVMYSAPSQNNLQKIIVDSDCIVKHTSPKLIFKDKKQVASL